MNFKKEFIFKKNLIDWIKESLILASGSKENVMAPWVQAFLQRIQRLPIKYSPTNQGLTTLIPNLLLLSGVLQRKRKWVSWDI